ncbi:hypothetical protein V7S43_010811 [Phytophthora oleae]|uniref:ABC transmembrane type-1 domain-containing protein n=1 Tax=Phytophthora oleae TaxID=2107226 RepID=A0ABD3FDC3_9STRA
MAVALEGHVREMVSVLANCLILVVRSYVMPVLANCLMLVMLTVPVLANCVLLVVLSYVVAVVLSYVTCVVRGSAGVVVLTRVAAVETPVTNTSVRRTT